MLALRPEVRRYLLSVAGAMRSVKERLTSSREHEAFV
jgi:hypothetical protein